MIFLVTNSRVSITRDFSVGFGNRGRYFMRMQISAGLGMDQTKNVTIGNKFQISICIKLRLMSIRIEPPLVVGIFMVVTSNLLLCRT